MTTLRPSRSSCSPEPLSARALPALGGRLAALALAAAFLAGPAWAQDEDEEPSLDWYFEFQAGPSFVPNQTLEGGMPGVGRLETQLPGYHIGAAIGKRIHEHVRIEGAVSWRESDIDEAGLGGVAPTDGSVQLVMGMINAYFDYDLGFIVPWIGAGLGGGEYSVDLFQSVTGALDVNDNDPVFVFNSMVGATVPVTQVLDLNFGYRYIIIPDNRLEGVIAPDPGEQNIDSEFDGHEVVLGARFKF